MKTYHFDFVWTGNDWFADARITVGPQGFITGVTCQPVAGEEHVGAIAIPGMTNVHSHAFQWTFAGKSEFRTQARDSFWTWREQMYASLSGLDVEGYYQSARCLYSIMVKRGYTSVGEFHYVHHDVAGRSHRPVMAMADALVRAATDVGMAICILPVLYQRGGFDNRPLTGAQQRFELTDDAFVEILAELQQEWASHANVNVGLAFHSLRAVDPEKIARVVERCDQQVAGPVHIHVAEQVAEVDDCLAEHGKRPVELLFELADVDSRWCLIHATHLNEAEIVSIARSGAVVGLCPTTEANLGDGIFPAEAYLALGGRFAVGSDSHIAIDPFSELRLMEYGQRLSNRRRAILCDDHSSCGTKLYAAAASAGAQALGFETGRLAQGKRADLVVLDSNHPLIQSSDENHWMDRVVFGEYGSPVLRTMINGQWV